jgi:hypothetical protein|uniref:Uncharacterized protein n=1 Tax=viral metagenome TaxID=1070528 RepID=A0A6C0BLV5_9ZZZZ
MWEYFLVAIGVAVATWLIMYIDSRLFDKPKKKSTYFKVISLTILIVWSTIYILTWLSPSANIKEVMIRSVANLPKITTGPTVAIPGIGEEMIAGAAPF